MVGQTVPAKKSQRPRNKPFDTTSGYQFVNHKLILCSRNKSSKYLFPIVLLSKFVLTHNAFDLSFCFALQATYIEDMMMLSPGHKPSNGSKLFKLAMCVVHKLTDPWIMFNAIPADTEAKKDI